jgi:hypothetical protein
MSVPAYLLDGERYAHGTRARYNSARCRCVECRAANARYESARSKRDPNPLVSADAVREHLRALTDAADVSRSTLADVRRGENRYIRQQAATRILCVDQQAAADHALVPARETWRLLRELISAGYRRGDLAQRLGNKVPALQLRRGMVLARTALKVQRLHAALMADDLEGEGGPSPDLYESPRWRILRAIRFFEWVTTEDLLDAMSIGADERNTYTKTLNRLAQSGEVERSAARVLGHYEYRSKP